MKRPKNPNFAPDKFRVALVGAGEVGSAFLQLLLEDPHITIAAVADIDSEAPGIILARQHGIPVISDHRDVFLFDPSVVVEFTGKASVMGDLVEERPEGVEVIGASAARFLWKLLRSGAQAFHELSALHTISTAVGSSLDMMKVLGTALEQAMAVTHTRRGLIRLLDEAAGDLVIKVSRGFSQQFLKQCERIPLSGSTLLDAPIEGEVLIVKPKDLPLEHPRRAALMQEGVGLGAVIPLWAYGHQVGSLVLSDPPVTEFSPSQIKWLKALGLQIGAAVERARLFADTQQRARELSVFHTAALTFNQSRDLELTLQVVLDEVLKFISADAASLRLMNEQRHRLSFLVHRGFSDSYIEQRNLADNVGKAALEVINTGTMIISDHLDADPLFRGGLLVSAGFQSAIYLPIKVQEKVVGILNLLSRKPAQFGQHEGEILTAITNQVGVALENARLFQEAQRRRRHAEAVREIGISLTATHNPQQVLERVAEEARRLTGALFTFVVTPGRPFYKIIAVAGDDRGYRELLKLSDDPASPYGQGPFGRAIRGRVPIICEDVLTDPTFGPWREIAAIRGVRSLVAVPLVIQGKPYGVLLTYAPAPKAYDVETLDLLTSLSAQAAAAVENARLFAETQRRAEELAALYTIATATTQSLHVEELLGIALDKVLEVSGREAAFIRLLDPETTKLHLVAHRGVSERFAQFLRGHHSKNAGKVIASGKPLVLDLNGLHPAVREEGYQSLLWIPLKVKGNVIGILNVSTTRTLRFEPQEIDLLLSVGNVVGVAVENARLFETVEQAYAELQATQQRLVKTETLRALGQMAGGVAHDFNNLLTAILGRTQILLKDVKDLDTRKSLAVIERAAIDGAETVRRIQEFTRIRKDRPFTPVDVNQAVVDALEFTRVQWKDEAEERGVRFQVVTRFGAVPPILGQAAEIREVLVNLILNALDAMPSGGELTITTSAEPSSEDSPPDHVLMLVSDTGTGISEEARPHVFDPFFTTKGPQSSGLGLSVVFGIVARHQGKIEIESQVGEGTTFRILLPVARESQPIAQEPLKVGDRVVSAKCLVIDDDASVRAVLADALASDGHQVSVVSTAAEGLESLRQAAYDVVFTDLGMPGMTGWEIARAVRTIRPGTPVILVTGWGVQLSEEEGTESGVRAVLSKPFEVGQLIGLLHEVLQSPEVPQSP